MMDALAGSALVWLPLIFWQLYRIANALDRIKPEYFAPNDDDAEGQAEIK